MFFSIECSSFIFVLKSDIFFLILHFPSLYAYGFLNEAVVCFQVFFRLFLEDSKYFFWFSYSFLISGSISKFNYVLFLIYGYNFSLKTRLRRSKSSIFCITQKKEFLKVLTYCSLALFLFLLFFINICIVSYLVLRSSTINPKLALILLKCLKFLSI